MRKFQIFTSSLLGLLFLVLQGCVAGPEVAPVLKGSFEIDPPENTIVQNGICYEDVHNTPDELITRKLDILIIPDTSGSLNAERGTIADGLEALIDVLPIEVDYQVGVMLAHGSTSSRSGQIYQKGSEPKILDSTLLTKADIKTHLRTKMLNPHGDGPSDGGEVGLFSLNEALKAGRLDQLRQEGFFREGSALAIIYVADENDICSTFPQGVVPVVDPQGAETSSYNRDCLDANGNLQITPEGVYNRLVEIQNGYPLIVGGVLYNNLNTIPTQGENELGYGYLEFISIGAGITVDLANGDYGEGLSRIGRLATSSIRPEDTFNINISNVDESSIQAYVNNIAVNSIYDPLLNQVTLNDPRDPFSAVKISYCEVPPSPDQTLQIVTGGFHSCALLVEGTVKCWGRNNFGQLGYGDTADRGGVTALKDIPLVPLAVGNEKVMQLSAGLYHTCALFENKQVKCWGINSRGQLGQGNTNIIGDDEVPATIPYVSIGSDVEKIYSGTFHNCVLLSESGVKCWGDNSKGQLGQGNTFDIGDNESPSSIGNINLGGGVVQLDLSTISQHVCALRNNGNVYCWGDNSQGQLGLGHTQNIGDDESPTSSGAVNTGGTVRQIATGNVHTCALFDDQKMKCWGGNNAGQLGLGNTNIIGDDESPSTIGTLPLAQNIVQITTGNFFSCALSESGEALCWGEGSFGKLGRGNEDNMGDDETLDTLSFLPLSERLAQIDGGINHTCARTKVGSQVLCWGNNSFGELGRGNTTALGDDETLEQVFSVPVFQ